VTETRKPKKRHSRETIDSGKNASKRPKTLRSKSKTI
jgi:hypothetical protein